jgi:hypothetical protein
MTTPITPAIRRAMERPPVHRNDFSSLTNADKDALFKNGIKILYANTYTDNTGTTAAMERNPSDAPLEAKEVQGRTDGRFLVRVESIRKRLADEDGLCEKYVLDCCRYAGLIPDDSPELCKVETSQRKAAKGEEEHTQITITYP